MNYDRVETREPSFAHYKDFYIMICSYGLHETVLDFFYIVFNKLQLWEETNETPVTFFHTIVISNEGDKTRLF